MKVIHFLLGKANPNTMNGVNKVVHHLATEQIKLNLDVEVWGITNTSDLISHAHVYPLQLFPSKKARFIVSGRMKSAIKKLPSSTIAHLHSVFIPELFMISRLLRKKRISWVFTAHGGYSKISLKRNRWLKLIYMKMFESQIIKHARILHAIGESEIYDFKSIFKKQRIILLPNGQDLDFLDGFIRPEKSSATMLFGYCGRFDALYKGIDLLLEGFSTFICNGGRANLCLIGDGKDKVSLKKLAEKLGIANKVKFLGPLYGIERLEKLAMIDVFVHTSRCDVTPTAALEAAALSKPLLISKETNLGPYVKRYLSGIVLQKNSPRHIASAMKDFEITYSNNAITTIGNKANMMIKNEFEWSQIANRINHEVYKSVFSG